MRYWYCIDNQFYSKKTKPENSEIAQDHTNLNSNTGHRALILFRTANIKYFYYRRIVLYTYVPVDYKTIIMKYIFWKTNEYNITLIMF